MSRAPDVPEGNVGLDEPQRKDLIVRAIDMVIAEVEERDDSQRDEDVRILRERRQKLLDTD